ncbi:hypothetical protein FDP41_004026 [Naegleria fowleri]|uniref:F-box domain-containing protein n=1 Tax=Naegleria fowleri TaxID=5763 RepID=A0A6A5BR45_NAEFO|nr:uncharacterized protein FDP41_004026 [Naegleria fowleri]KAF0976731.1 hypothetical protein FDP41_004026 [Naegleria fowleri]
MLQKLWGLPQENNRGGDDGGPPSHHDELYSSSSPPHILPPAQQHSPSFHLPHIKVLSLPEELQIYIIQFCTPLERFKVICRISRHFYHLIFSHRGWSCIVNTSSQHHSSSIGFAPHIKHVSSCIFDCAWFLKKKKLRTLAVGGIDISNNTSGVTASTSLGRKRKAILQARLPSNNISSVDSTTHEDVTIENLFSKCNFEHIEVNCSPMTSTRLLLRYARTYCNFLKTLIFGYSYQLDIRDLIEQILIPFSSQLETLKFNFQYDSIIVYDGANLSPTTITDIHVQPPQLLFSPKGVPFFAPVVTNNTSDVSITGNSNQHVGCVGGSSSATTFRPPSMSMTGIHIFKPEFELVKLKILDLYIGNTAPIAKQFFLKICQSAPNLRVCKLRGDIQKEMLLSLSKYCKYLEVLILYDTGKQRLTDDSISEMLKLGGAFNSSLRVLSMLCPSLTLRSVALITKFCKNLQYFAIRSVTISNRANSDFITFHNLDQLKVLKIKDEITIPGLVTERLVRCLPSDIEHVKLPSPKEEEHSPFSLSSSDISFKKLKALHLARISSETVPRFFLEGCAENLRELKLSVVDDVHCNIIELMKHFVPQLGNLTSLTLDLGEFDATLFTVLSHLGNLKRLTIKTRGNIDKYDAELGWKLKRFPHLTDMVVHSSVVSQFFTDNYIISLNNLIMMWLACPVQCKLHIDHEELSEEDLLNISAENVTYCCDQYINDHLENLSLDEKNAMKKEIMLRLANDIHHDYKLVGPKPNILLQKHFMGACSSVIY